MKVRYLLMVVWSFAALAGWTAERDLVYPVPAVARLRVESNIVYKSVGRSALHADVYRANVTSNVPAIIYVLGDADAETLRRAKDWKFMRSYGRLAAASGYVGITFNHRSSEEFTALPQVRSDVEDLLTFVRANATRWHIDTNRLCMWFFSGSGPHLKVALNTNSGIRCVVAYYPLLAPPPSRVTGETAAEFSSVEQLKRYANQMPPMLLAKAGRDGRGLNQLIDTFQQTAKELNAPVEFLEHRQGRHAFDILDDDETSREIVRKTVAFVGKCLKE